MLTLLQLPDEPESLWLNTVKLPEFPKLEDNMKTDVVIVGGGITGITAAYLLSKEKINVVLIEAGKILTGTTGHTTAKITAQHDLIYDELIQHFDEEKARKYYEAAVEAKELIHSIIKEHQIDCDFKEEDAYIFTNSEEYQQKLETEMQAYEQLNIKGELTDSIKLPIPVKSALIMKNQAQFHPLKYLKTLVEKCVENGVRLYENTAAKDIEYNKHPAVITEDGKRIISKYIISASHFPFYDKQSFYFARMYPERSYLIGFKTDKEYPGGMYISAESPTRSIRHASINGENLWLVGGENHKTGQGKSTLEHYENLKQFVEKHFSAKEIVYRWSAQDYTTIDKIPYIGPITESEEHVLVATGYRKWGMTNGTIAAKICADIILNKESAYSELYSPARFHADPDVKKFIQINADVAKHLIKGKLDFSDDKLKHLQHDDAVITRINGKRTGIYKGKNNQLYAVDTTCTHLGCEVEWNSGDRTWDCPCHGSRFSITGEVINGPAKEPLKRYEWNESS